MALTEAERKGIVAAVRAIAESIKEADQGQGVPSGPMYAALMGVMNLEQYNAIIGVLEGASIIRKSGHVLYWQGDEHGEIGIFGERL